MGVQFGFSEFIHLCYLGGHFEFLSGCLAIRVVDFLVAIDPYGVGLEDDPWGEFALPKEWFAIWVIGFLYPSPWNGEEAPSGEVPS
jgi:hypothetical protein